MSAAPSPWSERKLATLVERAVTFIRECIRRHEREFALEVGSHLLENIFKGDARLYAARGAWGRTALTRIAEDERVQISLDKLYMCIHYAILARRYGENRRGAKVPELSPWKWDRLWVLEDNPEALVAVADWAAAEKIPLKLLLVAARLVEPYLEAGGQLGDLLVGAKGEPRRDTPYKRMTRLLGMVEKWVEKDVQKYPPRLRTRMLVQVDELIALTS
jgi:hypothetical protein